MHIVAVQSLSRIESVRPRGLEPANYRKKARKDHWGKRVPKGPEKVTQEVKISQHPPFLGHSVNSKPVFFFFITVVMSK